MARATDEKLLLFKLNDGNDPPLTQRQGFTKSQLPRRAGTPALGTPLQPPPDCSCAWHHSFQSCSTQFRQTGRQTLAHDLEFAPRHQLAIDPQGHVISHRPVRIDHHPRLQLHQVSHNEPRHRQLHRHVTRQGLYSRPGICSRGSGLSGTDTSFRSWISGTVRPKQLGCRIDVERSGKLQQLKKDGNGLWLQQIQRRIPAGNELGAELLRPSIRGTSLVTIRKTSADPGPHSCPAASASG